VQRVFIAEDGNGVGSKGSGDATVVSLQTLLEAFLNMFLSSVSTASGLKEFFCNKMNKVFFFF
jgi:hypothetical protein